jgi:hypothetical protein
MRAARSWTPLFPSVGQQMTSSAQYLSIAIHPVYRLRGRAARSEKGTKEEVIRGFHDAISVSVLPPASTKITWIAGSEFCLAIRDELKLPLHRDRILRDECVVVKALASDKDDTGRRCAATFGRDARQGIAVREWVDSRDSIRRARHDRGCE